MEGELTLRTPQLITGKERFLGDDDIIVSKTNLKGLITYANEIFCDIADYQIDEVLYKPHNIVRHPNMPKCIFKLLWDTISSGNEIFAYVNNLGKLGDHYWVLAHITPSFDMNGKIIGYHSNRRKPSAAALQVIKPLYEDLLRAEKTSPAINQAAQLGLDKLHEILKNKGVSYEEFIFSIQY